MGIMAKKMETTTIMGYISDFDVVQACLETRILRLPNCYDILGGAGS